MNKLAEWMPLFVYVVVVGLAVAATVRDSVFLVSLGLITYVAWMPFALNRSKS